MAFSQPLTDSVRRKGQSAIICQLCEADPKIKWKCIDCGLLMCQRCTDKVHPKFASAEDHTIIDIKDISKHQADSGPKPDLTRFKCRVHSRQNCCLFCKTCQELVCQTCIRNTHNKHEFGDISDEYEIKMEKIRNGERNIEMEMRALTVSELKLKLIKSNEQSNYDQVKQKILDYDKSLKNEIKKHTDKLLKELDGKWNTVSKSFEQEEKKLKKNQSKIQKQIQEINTLLQQSNARDVFSESESLLKSIKINISQINTSFKGVPKFIPREKIKVILIHGKLEDVSIPYISELQVDKRFDTYFNRIDNVVSFPDGSLWLCNAFSDNILKVKPYGDNLSIISNFKVEVNDATLLPSADLLLSVNGSSNLKLVPSGSTDIKDSVYTVSPLVPIGVHVTCDNKIIVAAANANVILATGPRQVVVMDQAGHHEKVFQHDRHIKPLFTYPYRVTSNSQGNIAVVDEVSNDWRGRVVVLDNEGEVRNIYTGQPDVNNEDNPFMPGNIIPTPSDNFVVADMNTHTLHVLNSEGEIITLYNTEKMGISLPFSLSYSTSGQLYIGNFTYKDSKENAKLFIVNKFLC